MKINLLQRFITQNVHLAKNRKKSIFFSISMIIFAKICISNDYKGFILLFVHPAVFQAQRKKLRGKK